LPLWKKWIVWNGKYWATDEGGALIHEKGLITIRNIFDDLLKTKDTRERNEIEKFVVISESLRRCEAMIKTAQYFTEVNISPEELDTNPWLLNVRNGTINVLTGEFLEYCQENFITKIANVIVD